MQRKSYLYEMRVNNSYLNPTAIICINSDFICKNQYMNFLQGPMGMRGDSGPVGPSGKAGLPVSDFSNYFIFIFIIFISAKTAHKIKITQNKFMFPNLIGSNVY